MLKIFKSPSSVLFCSLFLILKLLINLSSLFPAVCPLFSNPPIPFAFFRLFRAVCSLFSSLSAAPRSQTSVSFARFVLFCPFRAVCSFVSISSLFRGVLLVIKLAQSLASCSQDLQSLSSGLLLVVKFSSLFGVVCSLCLLVSLFLAVCSS